MTKFIAAILVAFAFYWFYQDYRASHPEPVVVANTAQPGELSDIEKDYYVKLFNYTMSVLKADERYDWKTSDANSGTIAAGKLFQSKSSATCRSFAERFSIDGQAGTIEGIACKRAGSDGWCRLKPTDALTCALENPARGLSVNFPGMRYSLPKIAIGTGSGIGSVGSPNVSAPHVGAPDAPSVGDTGGKDVADNITGKAGSAAGSVASGSISWFNRVFR